MKILIWGLLAFQALTVTTAFGAAQSYSCRDLDRLRSRISKDEKIADVSVAAQIIRRLAEKPNGCVRAVSNSNNSVEVRYLDKSTVSGDAFSFSEKNLLVAWTRTFKTGQKESTQF
jgi:hypothetical protein